MEKRKGRSPKKTGKVKQPTMDEDDFRDDSIESDDSPARIPVFIPPSPGSSSHMSQMGPLQGSARVVKDHCADWHNHMQKWDSLNDKGFSIANKISNLILQSKETEEAEKATMKSTDAGSEVTSEGMRGGSGMPDGLQELCNEFTEIYNALAKLVDKMSKITQHFKGICELEVQTSMSSQDMSSPFNSLFKTWPVEYFYENSMELQEMYSKELDVKRTIVQDIAHHQNRDILMTYMSTWQHQPYIEDQATTILESMLHETGHR